MKFKVLRSQFIEGLKSVQNIVAGKGSLPILQNVMIEGKENSIKLTTTDLDISIKSEVACEVMEEGMTTLPVKLLFTSVTKAAEGEIVVECDAQERATIKAGSARFKLQGMPGSEFPTIPEDGICSFAGRHSPHAQGSAHELQGRKAHYGCDRRTSPCARRERT